MKRRPQVTREDAAEQSRRTFVDQLLGRAPSDTALGHYPALLEARAALDRFRTLLDQATDAVFVLDLPIAQLVDTNHATETLFRIPHAQLISRTIHDLVDAASSETLAHWLDGKDTTSTCSVEYLHKGFHASADAEPVWIEMHLSRVNFQGHPHAIVVARDITERRLAQIRYETLVHNLPGIVFRCQCNENWSMEFISPDIERLTGYPPSDFIHDNVRPYASLIHPEDRPHVDERVLEGVRNHAPYEVAYRIHTADGTERWVLEHGQGIFHGDDDTPLSIDGVIVDVTDRRGAEEALRKSEAFRKQVFESSRMPIVIMEGGTYRYIDCNDAAIAAYGYSAKEDVLGLTPMDVSAPTQYDGSPSGEKALAYLEQAASDGSIIFEWRHRRPDGTEWDAEVHLIRFDFGDSCMYQFSLVDITERKRADALIRQANEELERRVAERTHDLQLMNKELLASGEELQSANEELRTTVDYLNEMREKMIEQEKMASLGGLVAGVAHEINTPVGSALTAVTYLPSLLEEFRAKVDSNTLRRSDLTKFLDSMDEAVRLSVLNLTRAGDLVSSFKKISADQAMDDCIEFDLSVAIHDVVLSLRHEYKNKPIHIEVECPDPGTLTIRNHPGAFVQILTNLVMNSIRHGLAGMEEGVISITARADSDGVIVFYADNGRGMPPEVRAHMFDPFFTTARGAGGTGLGMSIVYNLVTQRMGGTIDVQSAPGEGVLFTLRLPG